MRLLLLKVMIYCSIFLVSCSQTDIVTPAIRIEPMPTKTPTLDSLTTSTVFPEENSNIIIDESPNFRTLVENQAVILYVYANSLRAWPDLPALGPSLLGSKAIYPTDLGYYATDFVPELNADGRYLSIPGVDREPGKPGSPDDATTWLFDLQTGATIEIEQRPIYAIWSPDGQQLAYVKDETLYIMQADSRDKSKEIFTEPGLGELFIEWSPDNQQVAIFSSQIGESVDGGYPPITDTLWIVPITGEDQQAIGTFYIPPIEHTHHSLQWSADGTSLFLAMTWPNYVITPIPNGNQTALADGTTILSWLPQRSDCLLIKNPSGSLLITDVNTQETIAQVSEDNRQVTSWAIAPDGRYLAYAYEQTADEPIEIYLFDFETYKTSVLGTVPPRIVSSLIWLPASDGLMIDDGSSQTPIWGIGLGMEGNAQVVLENGGLLNVISR